MIVTKYLGLCFLVLLSFFQKALAIMVPTGKVGPITPRKIVPEEVVPQPYREPAAVWERVDEGPNPYQPPVYKYTLLDFARKYGRKTLIPPPEEEYYRPRPRVTYYHRRPPVYYKTKFYYSPLQYLSSEKTAAWLLDNNIVKVE